jgi:uncharacterized protein (DUF2147 family)
MKKLIFTNLLLFIVSWTLTLAQTYTVTFKVDMTLELNKGNIKAGDKVYVRGNFNDWGESNELTDANGDRVYEASVQVLASKLEANKGARFKFFHKGVGAPNTGWENDFNTGSKNRELDITANVTLDPFYFNGGSYSGKDVSVKFSVDMTLPIKQGLVPGTDKVTVRGSFNDWGASTELTDPDADKKYTGTVTIKSGTTIAYKFVWVKGAVTNWESLDSASPDVNKDGNRQYGVVDSGNDVTKFWENKDPNVQIASGAINWTVDMSVVKELGLFSDVNDKVQIRGSFNGWSDSDVPKSLMNQNPLLPDQWFIKINYTNAEVNSAQNFKYYVVLKTPGNWRDPYERPLSTGGGDRSIKFEGKANQNVAKLYYDDVYPAFVVPLGQFVQIKFRVDMKDAFDESKQGPNKMVAGDKLYWISSQPLFTRSMNWLDPENQQKENFELTDPDGDKIYEGTLAVNGPSFNGFEYRYAYKKADGTWVFEPSSLGTTRSYRVRYISMTGARKFVQPYNAPQDSWLNQADKSSQLESWPAGLPTSVEGGSSEIPTKFSLEQNYPNPFNPTTTIKFNISSDQFVSLKVFNVLGQEVTTLVNEQLKAGAYQHDFNASKLSSGVYFYTLKAGDFLSTKKMLFLK